MAVPSSRMGAPTTSSLVTQAEVLSAFDGLDVTVIMPPLVVSSQRSLVRLEALVRAR